MVDKHLTVGLILQWLTDLLPEYHSNLDLDCFLTDVSTDSRHIKKHALFIPLIGERFDGHDYLEDVLNMEGVIALSDRQHLAEHCNLDPMRLIYVENTLKAYERIAAGYRRLLNGIVVAVSGSVGKTSCRDMVAACLSKTCQVWKTQGNLNNPIGVSKTILETPISIEALVTELGISAPNEMPVLRDIVQPDVTILTNIGQSHIEQFESQEALAAEKVSLCFGEPQPKLCLMNGDDPRLLASAKTLMQQGLNVGLVTVMGAKSIRFKDTSKEKSYDLEQTDEPQQMDSATYVQSHLRKMAKILLQNGSNAYFSGIWLADLKQQSHDHMRFDVWMTEDGNICHCMKRDVFLPLSSRHHMTNLLFGWMVARLLKVDQSSILSGAQSYVPTGARQAIEALADGRVLIDDSYNSSVLSIRSGLELLARWQEAGHRTVVCLAGINELGSYESEAYEQVGADLALLCPDQLYVLGDPGRQMVQAMAHTASIQPKRSGVMVFDDLDKMIETVYANDRPGDVIYVKGSNGYGMKVVSAAIRDRYSHVDDECK